MPALLRRIDRRLVNEGLASDVGHTTLDAVGLVPGVGEVADAANAIWYLKEERYFDAAMSILSVIPGVGDLVGKGIRYFGKLPADALVKRYGKVIAKYWPDAVKAAQKSKKLAPYVTRMDEAVKQAMPGMAKFGNKIKARQGIK